MDLLRKIKNKFYQGLLCSILIGPILFVLSSNVLASNSAIILLYHRFSNPVQSGTSLSKDNFSDHIKELSSGNYAVLPLAQLIKNLDVGTTLPKRSVVITIDDAYESFLSIAWPLLKEAGLPATLFLTTQPINSGKKGYLDWSQIKKLTQEGVSIGLKAHSQRRLATLTPQEVIREIKTARTLIAKNLGVTPIAFAFPYGLASESVQEVVRAEGYKAGFGQHSGVLHRKTYRYYLPRFSFTDAYGDLDRFKTVVNAVALPVVDLTPSNPLLSPDINPPNIGFTILPKVTNLDSLACYHSKFGKIKTQKLGSSRIEIRFGEPFSKGRSRINCTIPTEDGRWRWFGMQYYLPK